MAAHTSEELAIPGACEYDWRSHEPHFRSALEVKTALAGILRVPVKKLILMRNRDGIPWRADSYPREDATVHAWEEDDLVFVHADHRTHELRVRLVWGNFRTRVGRRDD